MTRAPVLFVSHGAPTVALETGGLGSALGAFAAALGRPRAIVVVSAHWTARRELGLTSAPRHRLTYDFGGFPRELYELQWPAPGAPDVAARAAALLEGTGYRAALDPGRGLDHGAWIPLRLGWPAADVPVVEIALPEGEPPLLARMGAALAPLRDEGILLVASGGLVHNLSRVRLEEPEGAPDDWAVRFDAWCAERIANLDLHGLARWREDAPDALLAQPTPEHLAPVFVALGAQGPGDRVETVHEGIRHGNLSMRSFALRPGGIPAAPHRGTPGRKEQSS
ncbi:MAG TPA: class III extradiol ring-cleavage dioxygenase [Anaeromyxobacter sp.]